MRLSGVLSKLPNSDFKQVDGFLLGKKGTIGQRVNLDSDIRVTSEYYCALCEDTVVFVSKGSLSCVFINKQFISIDCVLACDCGVSVPIWFLIESYNDIMGQAPEVRIIERKDRLSEHVRIVEVDEYTEMLSKSERAYRDGLGAGSIVYLRKVFEMITLNAAATAKIDTQTADGKRKYFKELLKDVDKKLSIIPQPFTHNKYRLYEELSSVMHGAYDEKIGLQKYVDFRRLVEGIIDNIKSREKRLQDDREMVSAVKSLGLNNGGGVNV